jgi:hypothetical protein
MIRQAWHSTRFWMSSKTRGIPLGLLALNARPHRRTDTPDVLRTFPLNGLSRSGSRAASAGSAARAARMILKCDPAHCAGGPSPAKSSML